MPTENLHVNVNALGIAVVVTVGSVIGLLLVLPQVAFVGMLCFGGINAFIASLAFVVGRQLLQLFRENRT